MKILKGILSFIGILFALFVVLVLVCAFHPELTERIADFLYPDTKAVAAETGQDLETGGNALPVGEMGLAGGKEDMGQTGPVSDLADGEPDMNVPGMEGDGIEPGIKSDYTPPDETDIEVPESLAGKTGYQQIEEDTRQIEEEEANQLKDQLSVGNTGDGLTFDSRFYPYYAMLDEKGRHLYRQVYANADQLFKTFAPVEPVTAGQLKNVFAAVYNDHPELFWMETAYACKCRGNGQCVEIELKFNRTAQNLDNSKTLFKENADQVLAAAQALPDSYGREKAVHDALIEKITYDMGAEMNQSAYSALVNNRTVCAGYARAFQYLLQQLGIPCYYCTGYAGENHAWNIVELSDGYYNVDTTWDDTGEGSYAYFNKTDADYAGTHVRKELSVYLPPCNGQGFRNLEPEPSPEDIRRSLEEAGFTEEQVLSDLPSYHADCYNQIIANGSGTYTFYNVIEGEGLLEAWYEDYRSESYRQAYMEDAMDAIGTSSCEIRLSAEELKGGRYLIIHQVTVR